MARVRPDHDGKHRLAFDRNKRQILQTQSVCGICGRPVDKTLKYPHPLSACIDHIIPIDQGGHPSDMQNLQLAHWTCNRQKGNRYKAPVEAGPVSKAAEPISNRNLPLSMDWSTYRGKRGG